MDSAFSGANWAQFETATSNVEEGESWKQKGENRTHDPPSSSSAALTTEPLETMARRVGI